MASDRYIIIIWARAHEDTILGEKQDAEKKEEEEEKGGIKW